MVLTNIKELDYITDKYYYKGSLFTGVTCRIDGENVEVLNEIKNGVIVGLHKYKYFPNASTVPHIHIDYIDFRGPYLDYPAFYKNEKFTGMTYEFSDDDSVCLAYYLFEDGNPVGSMSWYESGEICGLALLRQGISQIFAWFRDGSIQSVILFSRVHHKRLVNIGLDEHKRLRTLWIEENYFDWIKQHKTDIEFHYFETKSSFDNLTVSPSLSLIDAGVDDSVWNSIATNNGLKGLSQITLSLTSLSEEVMLELANIVSLTEIEISEEQRNLLTVAQSIKLKRPDCLILLNNQEI
jgi:hypothetical protein